MPPVGARPAAPNRAMLGASGHAAMLDSAVASGERHKASAKLGTCAPKGAQGKGIFSFEYVRICSVERISRAAGAAVLRLANSGGLTVGAINCVRWTRVGALEVVSQSAARRFLDPAAVLVSDDRVACIVLCHTAAHEQT